MNWTKNKPTVPGWYWVMYSNGKHPQCMLVQKNQYRELWVSGAKNCCSNKISEFNKNYLWYGPIDPPSLPEGEQMRISDIPEDQIKVGMRIRSLVDPNKLATIVERDESRDLYFWIQWNGDDEAYSGFFWNYCECEVIDPPELPKE